MSSNTPSSASGECIVCGKKPCETRCSACLANGVDYIFFCSTEHQRLAWPLHKRVCGIRSSPFRCPALSDEEVEEYKTLLNKPFFISAEVVGTWGELVREKRIPPGISRLGLPDEIVLEVYFKEQQESKTKPLLTPHDLREVLATRVSAWNARQGTEPLKIMEERVLIAKHPFDWIAQVQSSRITSTGNFTQPPWVTEALHRYTIYLALLVRSYKDPTAISGLSDLAAEASIRLSRHLSLLGCTGTPEALELRQFMFDDLYNLVALTPDVIARMEQAK
ncbi:hypothetical protein JCM5353_004849 [Sporobolomyces roseus]